MVGKEYYPRNYEALVSLISEESCSSLNLLGSSLPPSHCAIKHRQSDGRSTLARFNAFWQSLRAYIRPRWRNTGSNVQLLDNGGTTTWPLNLTGTMVFPTPASILAGFDPLIANLTSTGMVLPGSVATPTPSFPCAMVLADPDSGINKEYCNCSSSGTVKTLAPMTLPSATAYAQSCQYTSMPAVGITTNTSIYGPPKTYNSACNIEQQVGPNEGVPSRISGCATPLTTTSAEYVLVYSGEDIITQEATYTGGKTGPGTTVTVPEGAPKTISTVPPSLNIITGTAAGVYAGQTGSDLWYTMSSNVYNACSGTTWPITSCAKATMTGIPYPAPDTEFAGVAPDIRYGDLEIDLSNVNITGPDALSYLAYTLGANSALSIARNTTTACKNVTTYNMECKRDAFGGGCMPGPSQMLDACFLPASFLIQQFLGNDAWGANSEFLASFSFVSPISGDPVEVACAAVQDLAEAAMGFLAMFAWVVGPEGEVAATVGEAAAIAGRAAKDVAFGCDAYDELKSAATSVASAVKAAATLSTQQVEQLADDLWDVAKASGSGGFREGLGQIGKSYDAILKLF